MRAKDAKYSRKTDYLSQHPQLQYRMRAVLLDWIMEVGYAKALQYLELTLLGFNSWKGKHESMSFLSFTIPVCKTGNK